MDKNLSFHYEFKSNFIKKFGSNLSENVSLANYSWFNLGGNAEFFIKQMIKVNY